MNPEPMHHPVRPPSAPDHVDSVAAAGAERRRARRNRAVAAITLVLLPFAATSCGLPAVQSSDVSQGELMLQLSDALAGMRSEDADLQAQVDSLRAVVARQDSLLVRLAAATGVPVR